MPSAVLLWLEHHDSPIKWAPLFSYSLVVSVYGSRDRILAPSLASCVTLTMLFNFSVTQRVISFFFFFLSFIIYLLVELGLCCCARAFSSCSERGLLFIAVRRLLIAVASLVAEYGL